MPARLGESGPTNEPTSGLLCRRLSKGIDLNDGAACRIIIGDRLNTVPRRLHRWDTNHSAYTALRRIDRQSWATYVVSNCKAVRSRPTERVERRSISTPTTSSAWL